MFGAWNIVDAGLNRSLGGHHNWEAKSLAGELVRRGEKVRIFSHRDAPPTEHFAGAEIIPTFSLWSYDKVSHDPMWSNIENFVVHNRAFQNNLARHDPSLFHHTLTLFPTVGERQLLGLFRWLDSFPPELMPQVSICLGAPLQWSETDHSVRFYRTVWAGCPSGVKEKLALFARTPHNAAMFARHAAIPARVLPFVLPDDHLARAPNLTSTSQDKMVVSFVGGSRRAKGSELIADVVKQCSNVEFFIQAQNGGDPGFDIGTLTALSGFPHVRVHEGTLEWEDYHRVIAESVVLLPYKPAAYRWNDSGIYSEAKLFGSPVLVTAGTWLAEEVKRLGNGLVIETYSAAAIVDCISRARRKLPALKEAAARVQREFRETSGAARCIDAIAAALARPEPTDRPYTKD